MTVPPSRVLPVATRARRLSQLVWWLLAVPPPLSLAYLWSVRQHWLPPSFLVPAALAGLPLTAAAIAIAAWAPKGSGARARLVGALVLVLLELVWCLLVAAMVGFARALQSG
ncbi:hypothetical protein HRbin30_00576 [bacterium HR30]|nr:hypothetical protein HRbin30_00576 [bacterium HR30]